MSKGYGSKRCNFCGNDYAQKVPLGNSKQDPLIFGWMWLAFGYALFWSVVGWFARNAGNTYIPHHKKEWKLRNGLLVCNDCGELNNFSTKRAEHLNDAQKKVFIRHGMIHPRTAVVLSPDITLEDLNFRPKTLAQQTPGSCLMALAIMFGLLLLDFPGGWLLGIPGMIGVFYWIRKGDRDWDDDKPYTNWDDTDK